MEVERQGPLQGAIQRVPDADALTQTINFQSNLKQRSYDVTIEKIDLTLQNLILPLTFLGLTILSVLLLIFAVVLHWKRFLPQWRTSTKSSDKRQKKNMAEDSPSDPSKPFKVELIDDSKQQIVAQKILSSKDCIKFSIEPERLVSVVKTQNYGGSPKVLFDKNESDDEFAEEKNKFVFPTKDNGAKPSCSKENEMKREVYAKMPIPLAEQWMTQKKPYKTYTANIPRLVEVVKNELGDELKIEGRSKFSSARSPSLEKDDRSPFVSSAKSDRSEVFTFEKIDNNNQPQLKKSFSINDTNDNQNFNLRRYCSVNTKLNLYINNENEIQQEKLQNSPRILECSSAKERTGTMFNFSPKLLSENQQYSPKFFPESPRSPRLPTSPKNLDNELIDYRKEKPNSPRLLSGRTRSPKVNASNKENYFNFDSVDVPNSDTLDLSEINTPANRRASYIQKYSGRKSIERDRCCLNTELSEKKNYRRHHSCDTNVETDELISHVSLAHTRSNNNEADVTDSGPHDQLEVHGLNEDLFSNLDTINYRRQRLKSISLDSDNAKIIEQNLGIPIARQMQEESLDMYDSSQELQKYKLEAPKQFLCSSSDATAFIEMPRFSPKEFEITITESPDERKTKHLKNPRNLTIDLSKRDVEIEKEMIEFEKLYTDCEKKKVKTPTLKIKATSLDSSESANLTLPQSKTLEVPQNSISVPNTPKRNQKRLVIKKIGLPSCERRYLCKSKSNFKDSGVFLKENHANLMIYQPSTSRFMYSELGSFDENLSSNSENTPQINISFDSEESSQTQAQNFKPNLSVSSTNLKTLPEGVPSIDFETPEEDKSCKKLHRKSSNQSLMHDASKYSTYSLQSSNNSLSSASSSCHNLVSMRNSASNFSLNTENRQKKLIFERRNSNNTLMVNTDAQPARIAAVPQQGKCGLLQRRCSNNSLSLNIQNSQSNLSRYSSNSSLSICKDARNQKKGLLERRSSNTSLSLNINNSNPQLTTNRGMSISNYNLNGSTCNLVRYNSNQSINNDSKKSILERRSSNTSLTLNIQNQEAPREVYVEDRIIDPNLKASQIHNRQRKSLSTENLLPKSYKIGIPPTKAESQGYGSHENLWSQSYISESELEASTSQRLPYIAGDHDNEIIYVIGNDEPKGFIRNITTKPLSPQTTSEDFKMYIANIQHLQNASSILTRQQLRDLNDIFQNGYSKYKCEDYTENHRCSGRVVQESGSKEIVTCSEYQKALLRNLHQEFWDLPTNFQDKPLVSGSHTKNRYKTILPNEHSRVILKSDGEDLEGYINANFIKGHEYTRNSYIATQGPLQNTIYDFWIMVQQNTVKNGNSEKEPVQKIVMLTNFIENNKQKCEKYFPLEVNEEMSIVNLEKEHLKDKFLIKNEGVKNKIGYTIRKLRLTYLINLNIDVDSSDAKTKPKNDIIVYHYWFHNWADHKCPKDVTALLNLSLEILSSGYCEFDDEIDRLTTDLCRCSFDNPVDTKFVFPPLEIACTPTQGEKCQLSNKVVEIADSNNPPVIIHCSAGIGRTGCLIAILNGIQQLKLDNKVDILGIVCNMRLNRGGMVQNSEQYELIHKVLCLYEQKCLDIIKD